MIQTLKKLTDFISGALPIESTDLIKDLCLLLFLPKGKAKKDLDS